MHATPVTANIDELPNIPHQTSRVCVLRLDKVHPIVSGNKWFKLTFYLQQAKKENKTTLLSFGGAFSNHIVALASMARSSDLQSVGIIRGEKPTHLSNTLVQAEALGMRLYFTSRSTYQSKKIPDELLPDLPPDDYLLIPEGGYGILGAKGAATIMQATDTSSFTHIITAVGTGTTLAGLVLSANQQQQVIGIPVLKNAHSLTEEINALLPLPLQNSYRLQTRFHFGGYARHTPELIAFMNEFFTNTAIPTDFVYTAKAFYAAFAMLNEGYFRGGSKILLVHTGGLQGNHSLNKGTLIYGS